jgi:hypothetical protein
MTKKIRVENADNANYKVVVETWEKGYPTGSPDTLVKTTNLDYPTCMTGDDCYITSSRYLVIKEA